MDYTSSVGDLSDEEYQELKEMKIDRKEKLIGLNKKQQEIVMLKWIKEIKENYSNLQEEQKLQIEPTIKNPMTILDKALNEIKKRPFLEVKDEAEFQNRLRDYLEGKFPNWSIKIFKNDVDLVINEKYAIEVKIGFSSNYLEKSYGQILRYHENFRNLGVVILDIGKVQQPDLDKFMCYWRKQSIKTIIVTGSIRGGKKPPKFLLVKQV